MSRYCKTIRSEYPYCATKILQSKHTVGIFTSYCFTVSGHNIRTTQIQFVPVLFIAAVLIWFKFSNFSYTCL